MADKKNLALGTGRRKTSIARVYLRGGKGNIQINGKPVDKYFSQENLRYIVNQPFEVTNNREIYDTLITVKGGGMSGQAGAIRLGIARALISVDESHHETLRTNGFLTRDSRMVERKKYGRRGARRRFQFSKR